MVTLLNLHHESNIGRLQKGTNVISKAKTMSQSFPESRISCKVTELSQYYSSLSDVEEPCIEEWGISELHQVWSQSLLPIHLGFLKSFYMIDLAFDQQYFWNKYKTRCIICFKGVHVYGTSMERAQEEQVWNVPPESIYLIYFWKNYAER